jgi:cold shock CspA family protein
MPFFLRVLLLLVLSVGVSAQTVNHGDSTASIETISSPPASPSYDSLLDPPPLPHKTVTLIGGTVTNLDPVMNRLTIQPFGENQKFRIAFDTRTRIYADARLVAESALQKGQRVYVDTMLNGTTVFAKTIQIDAKGGAGSGRGQIVGFDSGSETLTVRDELSDQPTPFQLSSTAVVRGNGETRTTADLVPGSLVSLTFDTQQNRNVVREVILLAKPGSTFSFFGPITYVDLSRQLVALDNQNDEKNYEIHLAAIPRNMLRELHEGTVVGISAVFDGSQYVARNISFAETKQPTQP